MYIQPAFSLLTFFTLRFLRDFFAFFKEFERRGIQAISLSGWRRAVGEDVALMAAAAGTADLDPPHAIGIVLDVCQMFLVKRAVERRPASSRVEFMTGTKQRQTA